MNNPSPLPPNSVTPGPWRWTTRDYGQQVLTGIDGMVVIESNVAGVHPGDMLPLAFGWAFKAVAEYLDLKKMQGDEAAIALCEMLDDTISANSPGSGKVGQ